MKIVLSGVETENKGAELMLYAILQEIELRYPDATVYLPFLGVPQGRKYKIETSLDLKYNPYEMIGKLARKFKIYGLCRRLNLVKILDFLDGCWAIKGADYFLNDSGFSLSDQQIPEPRGTRYWHSIVRNYEKQNTKIIFLPQAAGPIETPHIKKLLLDFSNRVNMFMPREQVSFDYMKNAGYDMTKTRMYSDFTSLVHGRFPEKYVHLKGAVCVIPNMRMIDRGSISLDNYIVLLTALINECKGLGRNIYLLNHEGFGDESLARACQEKLKGGIEVVSGLNALEVKGLIGSSYLCISSRFHGVASALNSSVPCLATSWSHKYEALFNDYGVSDCLLPLDNVSSCIEKTKTFLDPEKNSAMRQKISQALPKLIEKTKEMWNFVWSV